MKLLGNNKTRKAKDKQGENVSHIDITEVASVSCNTGKNNQGSKKGFSIESVTLRKAPSECTSLMNQRVQGCCKCCVFTSLD